MSDHLIQGEVYLRVTDKDGGTRIESHLWHTDKQQFIDNFTAAQAKEGSIVTISTREEYWAERKKVKA